MFRGEKRVDIRYQISDISMVVICYASDVIGNDRRISELPNASLHITNS